jgi:hypothetical protein
VMNLAILGGKKWQFAIIGQNLVKTLTRFPGHIHGRVTYTDIFRVFLPYYYPQKPP